MIAGSSERNEERGADWKACITEVVFSLRDAKICDACIMEHHRIRRGPLPTGKNIIKHHIDATDCEAVLRQAAFPISIGLPFFCTRATIEVRSVGRTQSVLEEWIEFWIVSNLWWNGTVFRWQFDSVGIAWRCREEVEHFEEIPARISSDMAEATDK